MSTRKRKRGDQAKDRNQALFKHAGFDTVEEILQFYRDNKELARESDSGQAPAPTSTSGQARGRKSSSGQAREDELTIAHVKAMTSPSELGSHPWPFSRDQYGPLFNQVYNIYLRRLAPEQHLKRLVILKRLAIEYVRAAIWRITTQNKGLPSYKVANVVEAVIYNEPTWNGPIGKDIRDTLLLDAQSRALQLQYDVTKLLNILRRNTVAGPVPVPGRGGSRLQRRPVVKSPTPTSREMQLLNSLWTNSLWRDHYVKDLQILVFYNTAFDGLHGKRQAALEADAQFASAFQSVAAEPVETEQSTEAAQAAEATRAAEATQDAQAASDYSIPSELLNMTITDAERSSEMSAALEELKDFLPDGESGALPPFDHLSPVGGMQSPGGTESPGVIESPRWAPPTDDSSASERTPQAATSTTEKLTKPLLRLRF